MIKNLIAFRGLHRSWRYCLEDTLIDIQAAFISKIKKKVHSVDFLFQSYDTEPFTKEEKELILSLIDVKNFNVFWNDVPEPPIKIGGYPTLGYASWQINNWKCKQEVLTNCPYNRIFETRYDTINRMEQRAWNDVIDITPKEFHIYSDKISYIDNSQLPIILNDFTILVSGSTHDLWAYSYIRNLESMLKLKEDGGRSRFGAGEGWGIVFRKSGLIPDNHSMIVPVVLRTEQFDYQPVIYSKNTEHLELLNPVKPSKHYFHTAAFTSFSGDRILKHDRVLPAFLMQAVNVYRYDLSYWPHDITILINPIEKPFVEEFLKIANLHQHFQIVTKLKPKNPILLMPSTDVLTTHLHQTQLRFKPNNDIKGEAPNVLIIGGEGEGQISFNYTPDVHHAHVFFGDTSIWQILGDGTHTSYWSNSLLVQRPNEIFNSISTKTISDLKIEDLPQKGLINYPNPEKHSWRTYNNKFDKDYVFYNLNNRTILFMKDADDLKKISNDLSMVVNDIKIGKNFCSWTYHKNMMGIAEDFITNK